MSQSNDAYSQAVTSGKYDRGKSYYSKYDHVRLYWEDALTRQYMKPYVAQRMQHARKQGRGLRILDLGCGSGDGFEMFMEIPAEAYELQCNRNRVISYEDVENYTGVDLNQDLLNQNAERWGHDPKMKFFQGNLSQGLPNAIDSEPFDIYFASYGTLSHLHRDETIRLLNDIMDHAEDGSVILGDWLGRYSYEWQELWDDDLSQEQWMEYYISYIYPPEERDKVELSPLHLRLVTQDEVKKYVIEEVCRQTGNTLDVQGFFDRSVFIGRHMDTGDYNKHSKIMRQTVNSLFERSQRTDLTELLIDYHPHEQLQRENAFFQHAFGAWNYVIAQCAMMIYGENRTPEINLENPPEIAQKTVDRFRGMVEHLECFYTDDVRADVLEMQLGFLLRDLEAALQRGNGNSHGLVGIFQVKK